MLRKEKEEKRRMEDKVGPTESVVAPGSKFKGTISGSDSILISGYFNGEVNSERVVRIDSDGKVVGTIKAPFVIIEGELKGNVESAEHVELRSDCRMTGNINTEKMAMAEGSFFQGDINMTGKDKKPIVFVEKRKKGEKEENEEEKPE